MTQRPQPSRSADVRRMHAETARIHGNGPGQQLVVMSHGKENFNEKLRTDPTGLP
jgi:hypothetical protein